MSDSESLESIRGRLRDDLASGHPRSLAEYAAMFGGHDAEVARAFAEVTQAVGGARTGGGSPPAIGATFGPFRIVKELGRGGQGVVYLAEDTRLRRRVALKALLGAGPDSARHLERFRREAEMASKLEHPGICGVIEAGIEGGTPYIAMRYVEGESLATRIARARDRTEGIDTQGASIDFDFSESDRTEPSPGATPGAPSATATATASGSAARRHELASLLDVIERSARALHAAHEAGVIHRDVKPANIMVTRDGQPVILDFGLARDDSEDAGPTLTETGDLFGTPAYMSPEQLTGQRVRLDGRTDVYSLGVTLFECLALQRPFEAPTREGLFQAVLTKEAPDIRKLCRWVPADLAVVVATALEKDRERRYASALALAEDLAAVRESRPIQAKPVGPVGRALRFAKRRPMAAGLLLTLIIGLPLVTALAGYIYAHRDDIAAQERAELEREVESLVADGFYEMHHESLEKALATFERAAELIPDSPEVAGGRAMVFLGLRRPESAQRALAAVSPLPPALRRIEARAFRALGDEARAKAIESEPPPALRHHFDHFIEAQELMDRAHEEKVDGAERGRLFTRARDAFERAISSSERPRLAYFLGYAHAVFHVPETIESPPLIEALLTLWPDNAWSWSWASFASGKDTALALERLDRAAELNPDLPVKVRRSHLVGELGRNEEALALAESAVADRPEDPQALVALARAQVRLERWGDAEATARRILEVDPGDLWAYSFLSQSLGAQGRRPEAVSAYDEARRRRPKDWTLLAGGSLILAEAGRAEEAIAAAREYLSHLPDDPGALFNLGTVYAKTSRWKEAREALETVAKKRPDDFLVWTNLAGARERTGDTDGAIEAARRAVSISTTRFEPVVNLAVSLLMRGNKDEAESLVALAVERAPEEPRVLSLQGDLALARRDLATAESFYRKAVEARTPPDHITAGKLGNALMAAGKRKEGLQWLRESAKSDDPLAVYSLAVALFQNRLADEAVATYERLVELDPDHAEGHCNLGLLYAGRGDLVRAIEMLRRGHALGTKRPNWPNPSGIWLAEALARRALALQGEDVAQAIALWREALLHGDHPVALLGLGSALTDEETPEELRNPAEGLYFAQRAAEMTKRASFPLWVLAGALGANGFYGPAIELAQKVLNDLGGRNDGPFTVEMATERLEKLRAKAAAATTN
ncbi:MAG: tetratricopeptide repeat protein [Planctomycetota bacterium]